MFSTFAIENKTDKNIAKKVLSIFEKAGKNSLPVEISCWYAPEFQHFITVPNDNETLKKIEQGEEKSLNCKDWILHEDQVEFLMDKILSTINEKFELHFDLYEEDFISQDKIQE